MQAADFLYRSDFDKQISRFPPWCPGPFPGQAGKEGCLLYTSYFILGCTELPILQELFHLEEECVDPTTVLAKAAITYCGYQVKE